MAVLVSGSNGFIGKRLCERLRGIGYEVIGVDKETGPKVQEISTVTKGINIEHVVHLAAISSLPECEEDPVKAYDENVLSTIHLLDLSKDLPLKSFTFASTSAVYENSSFKLSVDEHAQLMPDLVYSQSKLAAENICMSYIKNYRMPISILRLFNVYGFGSNTRRKSPPLIGYIIDCLKKNKKPVLHGDGLQRRDYIYIEDVIRAIELAMDQPTNCAVNICSGKTYSVKKIYGLIAKEMGSDIEPEYREEDLFWDKYNINGTKFRLIGSRIAEEVNKYICGNNELAEYLLNFCPKYSISEGIKETVEKYLGRK